MMAKSLILSSPNLYPKPKCLKSLFFSAEIMDGSGTHNDKICAESSTGKTPNTPQSIRPIIWDIFEKTLITCPLSMQQIIASKDNFTFYI